MVQQQERAGGNSVDAVDVARFSRFGDAWWDPDGPMGKLHEINPTRIGYLRSIVKRHRPGHFDPSAPLAGLKVLDVGCGGGLLCEPLVRLGAEVTGIDPAENNVDVARRHAAALGLTIDYRPTTAEALSGANEQFDLVLAMEVVEHVTDRAAFMATICSLVKPGGLLVASTLNRTAKSFLLAIVGAEYVLRWLPRGTHTWSNFVTPTELERPIARAGLHVFDTTGMLYNPLRRDWTLGRDTDVNYFMSARRPPAGISGPYRP